MILGRWNHVPASSHLTWWSTNVWLFLGFFMLEKLLFRICMEQSLSWTWHRTCYQSYPSMCVSHTLLQLVTCPKMILDPWSWWSSSPSSLLSSSWFIIHHWWDNQDKHGCLLVLDKKNHSTHNLRTLPFHICRSLPHCSMNQRANLEMHAKSLRLGKQSSRYQLLSHQKMT